jgi:hypothetical protein
MQQICASSDVKRYIDVVGRFSSTDISNEITNQTSDIYDECGDPLSATITDVSKKDNSATEFYKEYYVGESKIYNIERVYLGTATKVLLTSSTDYSVSTASGMIRLTSGTVGGLGLSTDHDLIIHYVPNIFNKYCAIKTAEALLEKIDTVDKGKPSKELQVIVKRREMIERLLNNRIGVAITSDYENYDPIYGVNLKRINQAHKTNLYSWR